MLNCLLGTAAPPLPPSLARCDARYAEPTRPEDRCWSSAFGNHRWRKLFQKLSEKQRRYVAFHDPLAQHLADTYAEWNAMAPAPKMGRLVTVKCMMHASRIIAPDGEPDPVGQWEEWPPAAGVAWEVVVDSTKAAGRSGKED